MSAGERRPSWSHIFAIEGDPENWVPRLEAGENVGLRREPISTYAFHALSANYWNTSMVWYDTSSLIGGRIMGDKTSSIWNRAYVIVTQGSSQVCQPVSTETCLVSILVSCCCFVVISAAAAVAAAVSLFCRFVCLLMHAYYYGVRYSNFPSSFVFTEFPTDNQ